MRTKGKVRKEKKRKEKKRTPQRNGWSAHLIQRSGGRGPTHCGIAAGRVQGVSGLAANECDLGFVLNKKKNRTAVFV